MTPTDEQIEAAANAIQDCGLTFSSGRNRMIDAARAALTAAVVRPRVKPLVWDELQVDRGDGSHEPSGNWEAVTPFDVYSIEMGFGSDSYVWEASMGFGTTIGSYDDPDTAKAAAQADYEARILSALVVE